MLDKHKSTLENVELNNKTWNEYLKKTKMVDIGNPPSQPKSTFYCL